MGSGGVGLEEVKSVLQMAPRGMTIGSVSEKMRISRNSAAKYLDMLLIAGEVERRTFGRSKIYMLSRKVPLVTTLSLSSEMIVFIEEDLKVIEVNEQFLRFAGLERWQIAGRSLEEIDVEILAHRWVLLNVREALRGKEDAREICVTRGNEEYFFSVKLIPMTSKDGRNQIAIVYANITARKRAEIALQESEARYRAVVEEQSDPICRVLPDTTVTFANEACYRFFGRRRDDLMGRKLADMLLPHCPDSLRRFLENLRFDQPTHTSDHEISLAGERTRWVQLVCSSIFDDRRKLIEYQIVIHDITDLKRAEAALRESKEMFRVAFDRSPVGACILSPDLRFLRVNPEFSRITGYREHDLKSMTFLDLTYPDDREPDARMTGDLLAGCIGQYRSETRCIRKDGEVIWVRKRGQVTKDPSGMPLYFLPVFEDITAEKRREESLKITQLSVDKSADEVSWVSQSGRLLYVNETSCRKLGYSREELMNMHVWDIDPIVTQEKYQVIMDDLRKAGQMRIESIHRSRDGVEYPVDVSAILFPMGDEACMCACVRDISAGTRRRAT